MTSPQHAILRQLEARNTPTRAPAEDAHPRPRNGTMDNHIAAAIAHAANSEHGSDVSLAALSDYGSDIDLDDIHEDTALDNLLAQLAASAPHGSVFPSLEDDAQNVGLATSPRRQPSVHWAERAIQSSPVVASRLSVEFEYDASSRRAFNGTNHLPNPHRGCDLPSDELTAPSTQRIATLADATVPGV
jgi:hypothetical protein